MSDRDWSIRKSGWRWIVERVVYHNFAGSWYKFARENGKVQRFWLKKNAQAYADQRNKREGIAHD